MKTNKVLCKNIIITILSILVVVFVADSVRANIKGAGLTSKNSSLEESIKRQETRITRLEELNKSLTSENKALKDKNEELSVSYLEGNDKLKEYEKQIKKFKESTATQAVASDKGFRSWMPYTAISASSKQGSIVAQASPNEYGILEIDGRACVAIGTGWGLSLGDTATVYTKNGSYDIIVSDIKADAHTDSTRKITVHNGCVVEFIVDTSCLDSRISVSGSVASISKYAGIVTDIK